MTVSVAGFVLAVAAYQFLPKVYEAHALIAVPAVAASTFLGSDQKAESAGVVPAPLLALREQITAPHFLSEVLQQRPHLRVRFTREREGRESLERLRRGICVEARGEGRFEIAYRNSDATVAREVANAITEDFVQAVSSRRRSQYERRLGPLEQKLQKLQDALQEKKEQLAAFRSRNRDFLVSEGTLEQRLAEQEAESRRLAERVEVESRQLEILQAKLAETPKTIETQRSTEPDPKYRFLRSELSVLRLQRDRLLLRYTEKYPSVKTVTDQIEDYEHQLAVLDEATETNIVESINPLYQLLQQRQAEQELSLEQIRVQGDSARKVLGELRQRSGIRARVEQEYSGLTEESSEIARDYEAVLGQIRSLRDEWAQSDEPVRVLAWARLPGRPLGWGLALVLPAGLGLSVLLGLVAVFLAEGLDRSLRTVEQTRAALKIPVLGAIPVFGTKEQ